MNTKLASGEKENKQIPSFDDLVKHLKSNLSTVNNIQKAIEKVDTILKEIHLSETAKEYFKNLLEEIKENLKRKIDLLKQQDKVNKKAITIRINDKLIRLENYKKSLEGAKEIKEKTLKALKDLKRKHKTKKLKNNEEKKKIEEAKKEIDEDIKEVEELIRTSVNDIAIVTANISIKDSNNDYKGDLINIEQEIDRLENYRENNLKGLHRKEKKVIDKQLEKVGKYDDERKLEIEKGIIGKAIDKKYDRYVTIKLIPHKEALGITDEDDISIFHKEIQEFENNGFIGGFRVTEKKPVDWFAFISLMAMAFVQILAGAILTVCSLGFAASIGCGLLSEGVSDLITAVKDVLINRDFNWKSWGMQKAISFAVSLISAGIGAIKAAVKAGAEAVKVAANVAKKVVEATWKTVARSIGIALAKGIAKECATQLVDYGVNKALVPNIEQEIKNRIQGPIVNALTDENTDLGKTIKRMLEIDAAQNNQYYEKLIKQKAFEILNPQHGESSATTQFFEGVLKGVMGAQIKGFSTAAKIYEALGAISQLREFVDKFLEELEKEMQRLAIDSKLVEEEQKLKNKEQKNTEEQSNKEKLQDETTTVAPKSNTEDGQEIYLNNHHKKERQVAAEKSGSNKDPSKRFEKLVEGTANQMGVIVVRYFIKPATDGMISYGISKAFKGLEKEQEKLIQARHEYLAEQASIAKEKAEIEKQKEIQNQETNPTALGLADAKLLADKERTNIKIEYVDPETGETKIKYIRPHGLRKLLALVKRTAEIEFKQGKEGEIGHFIAKGGESYTESSGGMNCLLIAFNEALGRDVNKEMLQEQRYQFSGYLKSHQETYYRCQKNISSKGYNPMVGGALFINYYKWENKDKLFSFNFR